MKNIVFDPKAFKQFNEWAIEDKKLYKKIVDLIGFFKILYLECSLFLVKKTFTGKLKLNSFAAN